MAPFCRTVAEEALQQNLPHLETEHFEVLACCLPDTTVELDDTWLMVFEKAGDLWL